MLHPSQIRAARAALDWSAEQLAEASGVARRTLLKVENANELPNVTILTVKSIKSCLEAQGIEFTTSADGCPGIVIRAKAPPKP